MKDYLNKNERDMWLMMILSASECDEALNKNRGGLTKDEIKRLKTANTNTFRAFDSMIGRLNDKATKQLRNYIKDANVEVMTKTQSKIRNEKIAKSQDQFILNLKELNEIMGIVMNAKCKNCRNKFDNCSIFDVLQTINCEGFEQNNNCPYSYNIEKTKKKTRHDKKYKNRYNGDDTEYEYNFTPRGV